MEESLIRYEGVEIKQQELTVLHDVNLEIHKGEFLYVMGKVGSGKSSFLKTIYAELPITAGEATVMGHNVRKLKRKQVPLLRRKLGIVFQDFRLLTDRCVYDNLYFVLRATGWKEKAKIQNRIEEVLHQVGMDHKGYKFPNELSGGEQQRIVIARALLNSPELILADEPTGNLDPDTGRLIVELLHNISRQGTAVVMTTHNPGWIQEYPGIMLRCHEHRLSVTPAENTDAEKTSTESEKAIHPDKLPANEEENLPS